MLPMTTRKKLSHLRAQIRRQASKAARSRLEKRSSGSGPGGGSGDGGGGGGGGGQFSTSLDADAGTITNSKLASGDGYNPKEGGSHGHHQLSSTSSMETPPNAYLSNATTSLSSPLRIGGGHSSSSSKGTNQADSSTNSNLSPHQNESSSCGVAGGSGSSEQQQQHHSGSSKTSKHSSHLFPGSHHHSIGVSVHQKNFKQKLIALIKKFRTDGSDFDNEEQYREALERELMKAAAGRGSRAIEELLEEDLDVEEESGSEPEDWDNISDSSTPKPSLRPFFSSTTLDKL